MPPKKKAVHKKTPTTKKQSSTPKRARNRDPLTIILYGQSGNGKTSLAANFPRCKFLCDSQERGIEFLSRRDLVPQPESIRTNFDADSDRSWNQLLEAVWETVTENVETLVLESLTGIENLCFLSHCRDKFGGNFDGTQQGGGFFEYARGPKSAARLEIPKLIAALDAVHQSGKNVIITAHSQTKEDTDPQGATVMKYIPYCDKDTWARFHRWASCVFFLGRRIEEDREKRGLRKVAREDFDRLLFTEGTPYCEAKNWLGIHGVVHMGSSGEEAYAALAKRIYG